MNSLSESSAMKCPRCGGQLKDRQQSEMVTVWECPDLECEPDTGGPWPNGQKCTTKDISKARPQGPIMASITPKTRLKLPNVAYQVVRDYVPTTRRVSYNGVVVPSERRLLDGWFPRAAQWEDGCDLPEYEAALVDGLREHVRDDDDVLVVGGGWGVTSVIAARQTSKTVRVYEPGDEQVDRAAATIDGNQTRTQIKLQQAVVGPAKDVWGDETAAENISPESLPECDVLELDCEGAELKILSELPYRPRVILVETHGHLDCPTDSVREQLNSMGYEVLSEQIAEPHADAQCRENDIRVLHAKRQNE